MYTLYKFHFLNGISEINQLFDDILIIWPAPVYIYIYIYLYIFISAVKWLIAINRIKNKSVCLHNICVCTVYIYYVYIRDVSRLKILIYLITWYVNN